MAVTLKEVEGVPASWPDVTPYPLAKAWQDADYSGENPSIAPATIWRIIERWITTRWRSRSVVYTVEGAGHWNARLSPFTVSTTERWTGTGWEAVVLRPSPLDGFDVDDGIFRIAGTAGDASAVPDDVQEAWRRLHSYILVGSSEHLDMVTSFGATPETDERPRAYAAKAIPLSGAGDLLRPYRRLS